MEEVNELQANYKTGWIKIYRSVKKHWLYPKNRPLTEFEAWITILIEVNHESEKFKIGYEIFECNRGEKYYSLETWAKLFNWNKSKVRRFLSLLQKDSMIELKSVQKTTHLIVCNYESYQGERNDYETQVKRKRNASETQVTPIKEYKNDKEIKEYIYSKFYDEQIELSCQNKNYKLFVSWLFGENQFKRPLEFVLKMDEQVSFKQFESLVKIHEDYNVKIRDILEDMENWLMKNPKAKNSTVLGTVRTFAKRAAEKK